MSTSLQVFSIEALQPSDSVSCLHSCGADRPKPLLHACGPKAHAAVPSSLQARAGAQHAGPNHVSAGVAGPHGRALSTPATCVSREGVLLYAEPSVASRNAGCRHEWRPLQLLGTARCIVLPDIRWHCPVIRALYDPMEHSEHRRDNTSTIFQRMHSRGVFGLRLLLMLAFVWSGVIQRVLSWMQKTKTSRDWWRGRWRGCGYRLKARSAPCIMTATCPSSHRSVLGHACPHGPCGALPPPPPLL